MPFIPNFTITSDIVNQLTEITENLDRIKYGRHNAISPHLRRINRLRSIHSSLAIEGNRLSIGDVTSIIEGKTVIGTEREIQEVKNANSAYKMMDSFDPFSKNDILEAHRIMMSGLVDKAGMFRTGDEAITDSEGNIVHLAPHPGDIQGMMDDLIEWTASSDYPMMIKSSVFHYQFEYIHPFEDGNGRIGRLWQTVLLSKTNETFKWIPIESLIRSYQKEYYDALEYSDSTLDCTVFLEYMTRIVLKALIELNESSARESIGVESRLTSNELALYTMIRDGYFRDIGQSADAMGVSRATLNRCLSSLKEKGIIRKEGNKKSGIWMVNEKSKKKG